MYTHTFMKTILLTAYLILAGILQGQGRISFERDFDGRSGYLIDTVKHPNSRWQVGKPRKQVLDSALSTPNAIVTDTLNPLPPNDTSIFYLWHFRDKDWPFHVFGLDFYYKMDGDSTDYGTIEVSGDSGKTWINIMTQDSLYNFKWWFNGKPDLRGSSNGWKRFFVDMMTWSSYILKDSAAADTLLFRFTYITDSDTMPNDGWMLDNIDLYDAYENIWELNTSSLIHLYPNPVSDELCLDVKHTGLNQRIRIFDYSGKLLYDKPYVAGQAIHTGCFSNGVYQLEYSNYHVVALKKFVVQR